MKGDEFVDGYQQLLRDKVRSVGELDAIMFLARSGGAPKLVPELAVVLNQTEQTAAAVLNQLCRAGLARSTEQGFVIDDTNHETAVALVHLRAKYDADRLWVISELSANAMSRVRASARRTWARIVFGRREN